MEPRSPFPPAPGYADPGFGPFDGEALQARIRQEQAGLVFRSIVGQVSIILAAIISGSLFYFVGHSYLARAEAALAACAGV